jgi:signal transduction histidine kinase/CheY-like chemotaxis protein
MNSSAPLAFTDHGSATEALAAFSSLQAVASATLYDRTGATFATYLRSVGTPGAANSSQVHDAGLRWEDFPIEQRGESLGSLRVMYELSDLQKALGSALAISGLTCLVAVVLVFLASLRVSRVLIRPIEVLSHTAREISQTNDYSRRAPKVSDDEVGEFADSFNRMLEQIQRQDRDIQASRAEALLANHIKDEFLATLSHELRTPLSPIIGWAHILKMTRDPARVEQAAVVIERNAKAQSKIIEDLLDMSRIVSGKIKLDLKPTNISDVVSVALETVASAAAAKGVTINKDVDNAAGSLDLDPHRFQQVVWNLLSNAVKFTDSGGTVHVSVGRADNQLLVTVSDTGHGISADFLPHIFERFRQADSTSTRQHSGLGLGLAIAKQLVELHGGTLRAQSAGIGAGSTFTIALPSRLQDGDPISEEVGTANTGSTSLAGVSILLVDDENDTRFFLEEMLTLAGARVFACQSATIALSAIQRFKPDVLVSDIAMPDINGYALIREIRTGATPYAAVPALALTAFAREEDRSQAISEGFDDHLAKPIDGPVLLRTVAKLAEVGSKRAAGIS